MTVGVCYFPEHWPRERWETDAAQMAEAGIEYVRMAEFSWAVLEPEPGSYDFEWLDDAVEILADHGLKVVLCTPTATPPKWLVDRHPEILQADPDGTPRRFGSRRHYCFNSPVYRQETRRIVSKLAEHYADVDAVVGWQTDNEFGCHHTVRCYCEDCAAAFSEWLRATYDDIDDLNEKWGTTFWSQRYRSFEAVDPPRPTPAEHHPSHLLDYHRFASDSVVDYNRLHADILRDHDDWFVAHNFMGDFETLDTHAVADDLDLVTWDSYPTGFVQDRRTGTPSMDELRAGDPDQVGMNHDLYRGTNDAPFWVMEQQPGDVNWPPHCPQPGEGAMRLWAHHATGHGADAVLYFRWRRCREGQEQYHAGLRKQDGSADRGYRDATDVAADLSDVDSDHVDAPVALLHDYDDWWAVSAQPHAPEFDYWEHARTYYRALRARGVQVDVVHPETDLSDYAAVVAPSLHLADDERASHLREFVASGGELLLGARSGAKDPYNKLPDELAPGAFADLAGVRVDQHESFPADVDLSVAVDGGRAADGNGDAYAVSVWSEWLDPAPETETLATHTTDLADGTPAVTRNVTGDGSTVYCGVWPGADLADELVSGLLSRAGVETTHRLPDGVRVNERDGLTWVSNFTSDPVSVDAPADATFVVGDETLDGFDAAVVESAPADLELGTDD
ncbi:beta-galactosidase [Halogeometricum limi]|uniref:beta-galactosidase n=1 Tax=Halogeometricum limi TaxID=555875 RepID=A0A1I6IMC2_9EURY|nr:beta-galactosidase [Halogeometricum limi]SFR67811.1 beta-galactosidase [Halogeometricum limi]